MSENIKAIYFTYAYNDEDNNIIIVHAHVNRFNYTVLTMLERKEYDELASISIIDRKMKIYRNGKAFNAFSSYLDKLYDGVIAYA